MTYVPITGLQAQALPAAGAWLTSATAVAIVGSWSETHSDTSISFRVKYIRGGASVTGYPKIRAVWIVRDDGGNDVEMLDPLPDGTITIAATVATIKQYKAEIEMIELTGNSTATVAGVAIFTPPRWAEKVRIEMRELGDTANPGTVTVALFGAV